MHALMNDEAYRYMIHERERDKEACIVGRIIILREKVNFPPKF